MGLGAIVVIGTEFEKVHSTPAQGSEQSLLTEPLACVDIMGHSVTERTVERLRACAELVCVLVPAEMAGAVSNLSRLRSTT